MAINMKRLMIIPVLAIILSVSGCSGATIFSGYREIEDVELVRSIAIDKCEKGIRVTTSSGIGQQKEEPHIFEGEGATLAQALETLQKMPVGKETIYSHTERILISEEAAKLGISEYMDYIERAQAMRLGTKLYVIRGNAGGLLRDTASKRSSATDMMEYLEKYIEELGNGYVFTCEDVAAALSQRGSALVMAVKTEEREKASEDDSENKVVPAGLAVIRDGLLTGFLSEEESYGAMLLMGLTKSDTMELEADGLAATVEMTGVKTEFKPVYDGQKLRRVDISAEVQGNILSLSGEAKLEDEGFREKLAGAMAETERGRIMSALERSRADGVDFMGLGGKLEREKAVAFKKMDEKWEDIFPSLEFRISVSAALRRTYDIDDPLSVAGEEEATLWERLTK